MNILYIQPCASCQQNLPCDVQDCARLPIHRLLGVRWDCTHGAHLCHPHHLAAYRKPLALRGGGEARTHDLRGSVFHVCLEEGGAFCNLAMARERFSAFFVRGEVHIAVGGRPAQRVRGLAFTCWEERERVRDAGWFLDQDDQRREVARAGREWALDGRPVGWVRLGLVWACHGAARPTHGQLVGRYLVAGTGAVDQVRIRLK
jgi:hypothetical protein